MVKKLGIFLIGLFLASNVFAAAITSNGTGGGDWSVGASWTGGTAPGDGDDATIANGDTIVVDSDITIGNNGGINTKAIVVQDGGVLDFETDGAWTLTSEGCIDIEASGTLSAAPDSSTRQGIHFALAAADGDYWLAIRTAGGNGVLQGDGAYNNTENYYRTKTGTAVSAGAGTIATTDSTGWAADDVICVSGDDRLGAELVTISSVSGSMITISGTFATAHPLATAVGNMTRNFFIHGDATPGFCDIHFQDATSGIDFDFVEIYNCGKWAGSYGIKWTSSNGDIDNSTFRTGNGYGFYFYSGVSSATFSKNVIYMDDGNSTIQGNNNARVTLEDGLSIVTNASNIYNIDIDNKCAGWIIDNYWIYDGDRAGVHLSAVDTMLFDTCEVFNCDNYAFECDGAGNITVIDSTLNTFIATASATILSGKASHVTALNNLYYMNSYAQDAASVNTNTYGYGAEVMVQKFHQVAGDHRYLFCGASLTTSTAYAETTTVHTASNTALKMVPHASNTTNFEIKIDIPAADGDVITLWGYSRKDSTNFTTRPTIELDSDDGGIDGDYVMSDAVDTWEYFPSDTGTLTGSLGGTKSGDGYVTVAFSCKASVADDAFFDDVKIMIGSNVYNVASGASNTWTNGYPGAVPFAMTTTADGLLKTDISGTEYDTADTFSDTIKDTLIKADDACVLSIP